MRWNEVLGGLPPEEATRLLNGFTLGFGMLALAARRALRDQPVAAVERAAAGAHDALDRALALLPAPFAPPDGRRRVADPPALPDLPWSAFLDQRADGDGAVLRELLLDAVTLARRAGNAMVRDDDAASALNDAEGARETVADLLDRFADAARHDSPSG